MPWRDSRPILIAGKMEAKASVGRDEFRATPRDEFRLPRDDLRVGIPPRHVKGQRADDPRTEPANSHPPGLVTTMRMAARPSSCLQRTPAAPFDLSAASSICNQSRPVRPASDDAREIHRRACDLRVDGASADQRRCALGDRAPSLTGAITAAEPFVGQSPRLSGTHVSNRRRMELLS